MNFDATSSRRRQRLDPFFAQGADQRLKPIDPPPEPLELFRRDPVMPRVTRLHISRAKQLVGPPLELRALGAKE